MYYAKLIIPVVVLAQASKERVAKALILEAIRRGQATDPRGIKYSDLARAVSTEIRSRPTFDKYLDQLVYDRLATKTVDPDNRRVRRILPTPDAELEALFLDLAKRIDRLEHPTEQERRDFHRQLTAMIARGDGATKRLEAHPANVKLFRFAKLLEVAYSAFCHVHALNQPGQATLHGKRETSIPEPIWMRVKDGKIELRSSGVLGGKTA